MPIYIGQKNLLKGQIADGNINAVSILPLKGKESLAFFPYFKGKIPNVARLIPLIFNELEFCKYIDTQKYALCDTFRKSPNEVATAGADTYPHTPKTKDKRTFAHNLLQIFFACGVLALSKMRILVRSCPFVHSRSGGVLCVCRQARTKGGLRTLHVGRFP